MTVAELAKRVESLERDMALIKEKDTNLGPQPKHWLERIRGRWAGDPVMKEIIELGRAYRESLRPNDDENAAQ